MKATEVRQSKPWARCGYGARGVIYLMVGGISAYAAFTGGGGASDSKGVISELRDQPFGLVLLCIMAAGLACYSAWRFSQAALDADHHGHSAKALAIRAGLAVSCFSHLALCGYCLSLIFGLGGGSGDNSAEDVTASMMSQPYGLYLVGAVALFIGAAGVAQAVKGMGCRFMKHMTIPANLKAIAVPICAFGLTARGFVFLIIAGFFLYAAWTVDPDKAGGLAAALRWLQQQPYGLAIFGITSLGLTAFGVYSFMEAAWRKLEQ